MVRDGEIKIFFVARKGLSMLAANQGILNYFWLLEVVWSATILRAASDNEVL